MLSKTKLLTMTSALALTAFAGETVAQQLVLEEITVTARKREESLLDVPMSITALGREQLENFNIQDMSDISKMTPGMFFSDFGSNRNDRYNRQFIIRGLAINNFANFSNAAILFIDGAPSASGNMPGTLDIERVEVLKGPQTATFGRNTFTGAISVITRDPGDEWEARAVGEYSTYNSNQIGLSVSGPIIEDTLSVRISGEHREKGAQYTNVVDGIGLGGQTTTGISGTVLFTPTEDLEIRARANYFEFDDDAGAHYRLTKVDHNCDPGGTGANTYFCGTAPDIDVSRLEYQFLDQRWSDLVFPNTFHNPPLATDPGTTSENWSFNLGIDYTFDNDWLFEATTAYGKTNASTINNEWYNPDGDPAATDPAIFNRFYSGPGDSRRNSWSWLYNLERYFQDFSQEVRLSSDTDDRLRWTVGANYVAFEGASGLLGDVPLGAPLLLPSSQRKTKTWSGFAGVFYDVVDNLELGLEGRYQSEDITDTPRWTADRIGLTPLNGKWKFFTPRVSIKYKPTEDVTLYGQWAQAKRPGAFNSILAPGFQSQEFIDAVIALTGAKLEVDPEDMDTYELGVKARILDGRGNVTLSVYTGSVTNQQTTQSYVLTLPLVGIGSVFVNEGKTNLKGIEFDTSIQVTEELTVSAAYAYNDSEIKTGGDAGLLGISGGLSDGVGNRLAATPRTSGNVTARYTSELSESLDWYVGGEYTYRGGIYATHANLVSTGKQHLVNARVGVENDDMSIELWGKNILDSDTPEMISRPFDYDSFQTVGLQISLPRKPTFGVRMNYNF